MIGYLEGKLLKKEEDRILLLVNQVGYEVLLPAVVMASVNARQIGDELSFYIYHHQTERQPKPVLIGFNLEVEKDFFQYFISVEAIGPLKAVKALNIPVDEIARAIEARDVRRLQQLKGIGSRTAQKIVASLEGKMDRFVHTGDSQSMPADQLQDDFVQQVVDVLIEQLGYKAAEARQMIKAVMKRFPDISTPEALFEEVYRAGANSESQSVSHNRTATSPRGRAGA